MDRPFDQTLVDCGSVDVPLGKRPNEGKLEEEEPEMKRPCERETVPTFLPPQNNNVDPVPHLAGAVPAIASIFSHFTLLELVSYAFVSKSWFAAIRRALHFGCIKGGGTEKHPRLVWVSAIRDLNLLLNDPRTEKHYLLSKWKCNWNYTVLKMTLEFVRVATSLLRGSNLELSIFLAIDTYEVFCPPPWQDGVKEQDSFMDFIMERLILNPQVVVLHIFSNWLPVPKNTAIYKSKLPIQNFDPSRNQTKWKQDSVSNIRDLSIGYIGVCSSFSMLFFVYHMRPYLRKLDSFRLTMSPHFEAQARFSSPAGRIQNSIFGISLNPEVPQNCLLSAEEFSTISRKARSKLSKVLLDPTSPLHVDNKNRPVVASGYFIMLALVIHSLRETLRSVKMCADMTFWTARRSEEVQDILDRAFSSCTLLSEFCVSILDGENRSNSMLPILFRCPTLRSLALPIPSSVPNAFLYWGINGHLTELERQTQARIVHLVLHTFENDATHHHIHQQLDKSKTIRSYLPSIETLTLLVYRNKIEPLQPVLIPSNAPTWRCFFDYTLRPLCTPPTKLSFSHSVLPLNRHVGLHKR